MMIWKITVSMILLLACIMPVTGQDHLVGYWSFDHTNNGTFYDETGKGNHGTRYGTSIVRGIRGNALSFNGNGDYAAITSDGQNPPSELAELDSGSISLWFKAEEIPTDYGIAPLFYYGMEGKCDFFDAANKGMIIELGHSPIFPGSESLFFTIWKNGCTYPSFCYDSNHPVSAGEWHHFVAVVGSDYNTGFLNGKEMTRRKYNFGNDSYSQFFSDALAHEKLWLGKGHWDRTTQYFNGAIDELRIYDKPLSSSEVKKLYEQKAHTTYKGPVKQISRGYGSFGSKDVEFTTFQSPLYPAKDVTIFYPEGISEPRPAVMFAHGYTASDTVVYNQLLNFIASNNYVAVFSPYKILATVEHNYNIILQGFLKAARDHPGIIDTTKIGIMGHSFGGGACPWLGKKLFMERGWGENGRFLFPMAPWYAHEIEQDDLSGFPADCKMIMQIYNQDSVNDHRLAIDVFNHINIPAPEKDFINVFTDILPNPPFGDYIYKADHGVPTTLSERDRSYDALDFYAVFRLLHALMDYTFHQDMDAKNIALGNGSDEQTDMGMLKPLKVSDNPVPLHPQSGYKHYCKKFDNPRQVYCTCTDPMFIMRSKKICSGDSVLLADRWRRTEGTYLDTTQTPEGCIRYKETRLLVNPVYKDTQNETICMGDSIFLENAWQSRPGMYLDTFQSAHHCDSVVHTTLSVIETDLTISEKMGGLTANETGAIYQWLDCEQGFASVEGETGKSFSPIRNGQFAVVITKNGCTDTSACMPFAGATDIPAAYSGGSTLLYPNPASEYIYVQNNHPDADLHHILIHSLTGEQVLRISLREKKKISVQHIEAGIYFLSFENHPQIKPFKVVIK
jgi:hypothetical protein